MSDLFVSASVKPLESLDMLSPYEVERIRDRSDSGLYPLFRQCALAVLNCGSEMDCTAEVLEKYQDFDVHIVNKHRGVQLDLINAPASAFVDGELVDGIREHLFSVLRDLVYVVDGLNDVCEGLTPGETLTNTVFHILRHAKSLRPNIKPNIVVCWGGHSIARHEYAYTKKVGYELGLRGLNICTGCGPGAMKGPMKGATIAHAKQRISDPRYIGITEPGIIAAESPNPIVSELITMPDIEKRLEAFVRLGHGVIVFPGGAGTAEEILYMLGILLQEQNRNVEMPFIFTGPAGSEAYFEQIDQFVKATLGEEASKLYQVVIDHPSKVAALMKEGLNRVTEQRKESGEAYHFNWQLQIPYELQLPFEPTHDNMAALNLHKGQPISELASELRKALSGIVSGNVKEPAVKAVAEKGPFILDGDPEVITALDKLLNGFIEQRRMKIDFAGYVPCFKLAS
ncbi:MAG: nucleotide 5'-monophosphate nucleosidase PpnN [Marinobacterium sp.]